VVREAFGTFDHVVHSGYARTMQTLDHMLEVYTADERARMSIRHHLFVRERDGGHTYDMTDAEVQAAFPWLNDTGRRSARSSRVRPAAKASPTSARACSGCNAGSATRGVVDVRSNCVQHIKRKCVSREARFVLRVRHRSFLARRW
jgi:hypothetical protein